MADEFELNDLNKYYGNEQSEALQQFDAPKHNDLHDLQAIHLRKQSKELFTRITMLVHALLDYEAKNYQDSAFLENILQRYAGWTDRYVAFLTTPIKKTFDSDLTEIQNQREFLFPLIEEILEGLSQYEFKEPKLIQLIYHITNNIFHNGKRYEQYINDLEEKLSHREEMETPPQDIIPNDEELQRQKRIKRIQQFLPKYKPDEGDPRDNLT